MDFCLYLQPGDKLIWVARCTKSDSLLLANSEGRSIRFCADDSQVCCLPSYCWLWDACRILECVHGITCCFSMYSGPCCALCGSSKCARVPGSAPFCPRSRADSLLAATSR